MLSIRPVLSPKLFACGSKVLVGIANVGSVQHQRMVEQRALAFALRRMARSPAISIVYLASGREPLPNNA
jgi:hypothetical protein